MAAKQVAQTAAKALSRPPAMDKVFSRWDDWTMLSLGATTVILSIGTFVPITIWAMKYREWYRNYDSKATYERQKKAGVFMSIRPDGTYRRYYNRIEPDEAIEMYRAEVPEEE